MHRSLRAVATTAIVAALLMPTDASAQLDARENPTKRGPLVRDGGRCEKERTRAGGRLAAISRSCSDVYAFNPLRENKPGRDYGAVWLQATVDTTPGWCSRAVVMEIRVPEGVRIESRTPTYERAADSHRDRARIVVNAGGTAERNGVLKNHFWLHPRRIKPNLEGRSLFVDWKGDTPKTLGFAAGVEISWDADEGFPRRSPKGTVISTLQSC